MLVKFVELTKFVETKPESNSHKLPKVLSPPQDTVDNFLSWIICMSDIGAQYRVPWQFQKPILLLFLPVVF